MLTMTQILMLVGKLDDTPGQETARDRFRQFLREHVTTVAQLRDYVQECISHAGGNYSRALQDLVNHAGTFLGFEVTFGRYQGARGQIGFDGLWRSPTGFHFVIEVKTSETYPIRTPVLIGYIDELISHRLIPDWEHAMGLYVVGRPDPEVRQLENAIVAEGRTQKLRVISVEALLKLVELKTQYNLSHDQVLAVLRPSAPRIDPIVDLMADIAAQGFAAQPLEQTESRSENLRSASDIAYWLAPVKSEEVVRRLVEERHLYAFSERQPGHKRMKPGDRICFYVTMKGVVADAEIASGPAMDSQLQEELELKDYPWIIRLANVRLYVDKPRVLDEELRSRLEVFAGRDLRSGWGWFVQTTRQLSAHDFELLTKGGASA